MSDSSKDSEEALREAIGCYNDAATIESIADHA